MPRKPKHLKTRESRALNACIAREIQDRLAADDRSQVWLAKKLGMSSTWINNHLSRDATFDIDAMAAIAKALGVSFTELIGAACTNHYARILEELRSQGVTDAE